MCATFTPYYGGLNIQPCVCHREVYLPAVRILVHGLDSQESGETIFAHPSWALYTIGCCLFAECMFECFNARRLDVFEELIRRWVQDGRVYSEHRLSPIAYALRHMHDDVMTITACRMLKDIASLDINAYDPAAKMPILHFLIGESTPFRVRMAIFELGADYRIPDEIGDTPLQRCILYRIHREPSWAKWIERLFDFEAPRFMCMSVLYQAQLPRNKKRCVLSILPKDLMRVLSVYLFGNP